jgi:uncharacterized membrane protein YhaH (DUF805 family)
MVGVSRYKYEQARSTIWPGIICLFLFILSRFIGAGLIFPSVLGGESLFLTIFTIFIGLGTIYCFVAGSWGWAKYKGRSGWWALLGLLAPIGFIPLALMKDKYVEAGG